MEEKHTIKIEFELDLFEQLPPNIWNRLTIHIANHECENCGSPKYIVAHHVDENRKNNSLVNGRCLCRSCHQKTHIKLRTDKVLLDFMLSHPEHRGGDSLERPQPRSRL